MSYPHPCFNPLIPNQIECNNKQLLLLVMLIDTCNYMFGRAICDASQECIFKNFEIAQVKRGQFQNLQKSRERLIPKITRTKYVITG